MNTGAAPYTLSRGASWWAEKSHLGKVECVTMIRGVPHPIIQCFVVL